MLIHLSKNFLTIGSRIVGANNIIEDYKTTSTLGKNVTSSVCS